MLRKVRKSKRQVNVSGLRGSPARHQARGSTIRRTKLSPAAKKLIAYDIFQMSIARARNQIKIHQAAHGRRAKPEHYLADAHRAAIVLAIAALDAFVRSFVISRIRAILADKTKTLEPSLADHIKRFLKEDGLLEAARNDDLHERVEKAFTGDFERKSFQGTDSITKCFQMVGIKNVFHQVAVKARVNEDNLKDDLDRFTKRRHIIAHCGDYDLSQNPPVENKVTKKYAEDCIKTVSIVAKAIHSL